MYHDVPSRRYLLAIQPGHFPQSSPDTVAPHRGPQRFFYAEAEPAFRKMVHFQENAEMRAGVPPPGSIYRVKLRLAQQLAGLYGNRRPRRVLFSLILA